jgi:hypothetical protein
VLIELTRGPTTASQINGAIQEIKDILGTTGMQKTGPLHYQPTNDNKPSKPNTEVPAWYKKLTEKKK